ncbi:MAG: DUF1289 domain-containing protein [Alphaproteobacteria bacterium]|nr:DUF1289 domain-containing protein [Alphaproteobacteria bacterium]
MSNLDKHFESQPPSPCVGSCAISARAGFCIGCGRKFAEIGGWQGFSPSQKQEVLAALPARLASLKPS